MAKQPVSVLSLKREIRELRGDLKQITEQLAYVNGENTKMKVEQLARQDSEILTIKALRQEAQDQGELYAKAAADLRTLTAMLKSPAGLIQAGVVARMLNGAAD